MDSSFWVHKYKILIYFSHPIQRRSGLTKRPAGCYFSEKGEIMKFERSAIIHIKPLGFPWETEDPFLFCVYHADAYPNGNKEFGPDTSLAGRQLGNDFRLKDGWRMYHGKTVPGFPVHPHRGFETVTVVRKGLVDHSDSLGGAGRYGDGDVQWMTAGKGIQHAEMFPLLKQDAPNPLELFQIWLNLPKAHKMVDAHYAMLWNETIPIHREMDENGKVTTVEIVAGSLGGLYGPDPAPKSWAANSQNEVAIWYFQMEDKGQWSLPLASEGINRTLYFFEGDQIQINQTKVEAGNAVLLDPLQEVLIENGESEGRFLLLQGRPIQEPVVNYGPFVMNTEEEIQQTYRDFQENQFGGWPWPRPDQVHPPEKGRFALHPGGEMLFPPESL
jgi:redox-sensitive bicupin YhaK (pirin superfamily)